MSNKTTSNSYSKISTKNKISTLKNLASKKLSLKVDYDILPNIQKHSFFSNFSVIQKNLKKYSTTPRKYHIFIINSIIFDHRIHKVAVFKNNLLWDESSEFLKRFYKIRESVERIPKISEYYEKYTLFPPVYFGFEGLIVIIMNKWTKRKKNYLEYIEDHEDEKEEKKKRKKNISFEPLINPSLITNKASSKSIISKNTLDLSKLDNDSKKNILHQNTNKNNNKIISNKKEDINSLSFSEIIDDLSSHYSIIINNNNNNNNNNINTNNNNENINNHIINSKSNNKHDKKFKKNQISNKSNKKQYKKEGRNEINVNICKPRNTYYNNTTNNSKLNIPKISDMKTTDSPRKKIKICLNKKNNKYILSNNNTNIIKRNNNKLPLPSEMKKYQKKIMNTDNHMFKTQDIPIIGVVSTKNSTKGAIKVNTICNYLTEKNKNINNNLLQKKEESNSTKKTNSNYIKNSIKKNIIYNNKKKYSGTINPGNIPSSIDKNLMTNINYNIKNILKQKNYIQINRKSLIESSNTSTSINFQNNTHHHKTLTNRNSINHPFYLTNDLPTVSNLIARTSLNKEKSDSINTKDKNITKKKIYLEDPFIYKLTQLTKKRQISLTSTNSLSKLKDSKNFTYYGINSIMDNNNSNNNNNIFGLTKNNYNNNKKKFNKMNCRKNLVLTKLNSKKNMNTDNKNKLLGEDIIRNNSTSIHKNNNFDNSIKISNSQSFRPKNNSKNINLNLNLNIHFNIDVENKNKGKKILLNNAIINQLQNKINKKPKYTNIIRNKDIINHYSLTSKNSKKYIKDLNDLNKIEYTILKKFQK